ncbi:MAG: pantetheine-phosphate adenylyltransferase [Elusimicrobiota bacterium]
MKKLMNFSLKNTAVYPGSFDPPTNGHIDIIQRASTLFSKVIISITDNPNKKPFFSVKERKKMLKESLKKLKNIEIDSFSGLLVHYLKKRNVKTIIRGLRAISDFEYEFQLALMNRRLGNTETVFLIPDETYTYVSSSLVKEIAELGGGIKGLVPEIVEKFLSKKING